MLGRSEQALLRSNGLFWIGSDRTHLEDGAGLAASRPADPSGPVPARRMPPPPPLPAAGAAAGAAASSLRASDASLPVPDVGVSPIGVEMSRPSRPARLPAVERPALLEPAEVSGLRRLPRLPVLPCSGLPSRRAAGPGAPSSIDPCVGGRGKGGEQTAAAALPISPYSPSKKCPNVRKFITHRGEES